MLAHNAYPYDGQYGDRLDRVLSTGGPVVIEEDLVWVDGKSLLIHNANGAGPDSPTLESYFFPKVRPVIEKALKESNHGNWPLITLYLDIKNDPVEHLEAWPPSRATPQALRRPARQSARAVAHEAGR